MLRVLLNTPFMSKKEGHKDNRISGLCPFNRIRLKQFFEHGFRGEDIMQLLLAGDLAFDCERTVVADFPKLCDQGGEVDLALAKGCFEA